MPPVALPPTFSRPGISCDGNWQAPVKFLLERFWENMKRTTRTRTSFTGFWPRVTALPLILALQGCFFPTRFTETTPLAKPISLTRLYVYSFLDIRTSDLGPQMMSEISRQLAAGLESRGIASEQHWFRNDPLAAGLPNDPGSEFVPVRRVIQENAARERRFGSDYRLIAFPLELTADGPNYEYNFQWTLEDTRTNEVVWSTISRSRHMNLVDPHEDPVNRAGSIVNRLIALMDASGLFIRSS